MAGGTTSRFRDRRRRQLDDVGTPGLEQVRVRSSDPATHIRYRVLRGRGE